MSDTFGDTSSGPESEWSTPHGAAAVPGGGGGLRDITEKFAVSPSTGLGGAGISLAVSAGRSGIDPALSLAYSSGGGNGPFGLGWSLNLPEISRKTSGGVPQYSDATDTFLLDGAEDLIPDLEPGPDGQLMPRDVDRHGFRIRRFRPRIEATFARIERWTRLTDAADVHWRVMTAQNVLSIFGASATARVADPEDPARIFSWMLEEVRDPFGNLTIYQFKAEDGAGIDLGLPQEANRGPRDDPRRGAVRYLKRVLYGNQTSSLDTQGDRPRTLAAGDVAQRVADGDFHFELVFDYGEHDDAVPTHAEDRPWPVRADPSSNYTAGFERRISRLCRRVLMFHHFADEAGVGIDCLTASTDFSHVALGDAGISGLVGAKRRGYTRTAGGYSTLKSPMATYHYALPEIDTDLQDLPEASSIGLPTGFDDQRLIWRDLFGNGLPGALLIEDGAWRFKANRSPLGGGQAQFDPPVLVPERPNPDLAGPIASLVDVAAEGTPGVMALDQEAPGAFGRNDAGGWEGFAPFDAAPTQALNDQQMRLFDVDGDGVLDGLMLSADSLTYWHFDLDGGFGPPIVLPLPDDEEAGPRAIFTDRNRAIFLADMTGDGLSDILRIRAGEVSYWPNLGHGKFGARVVMDSVPQLDHPTLFDPRRIRLGDVDGTGAMDLVYLHRDGVRLLMNRFGNGFAPMRMLGAVPDVDTLCDVQIVDLLGTGLACLVWSTQAAGHAGMALRYLQLMGRVKPYLLTRTENGLGAETRITYTPSTQLYLEDEAAGRPWATRLPFPVHVVTRIEQFDHIARHRFAQEIRYRHGHYDPHEREFRGFGLVEISDAEAFGLHAEAVGDFDGYQDTAPEFQQAPVTTRTWYHLGTHAGIAGLDRPFEDEFFGGAAQLSATVVPAGLSTRDWRDATRALKGTVIRQETYSFDGSDVQDIPYGVVETRYELRRNHPGTADHAAVFSVFDLETISYNYDRTLADPRVTHSFALNIGQEGQVERSAKVVYPRQIVDATLPDRVRQAQARQSITVVSTRFTNGLGAGVGDDHLRLTVPWDRRIRELTGVVRAGDIYTLAELRAADDAAAEIDFSAAPDPGQLQSRPLGRSLIRLRDPDLAPLPFGQQSWRGLPHQTFQLAYTDDQLADYGGEVSNADLTAAGYEQFAGEAGWWAPSGIALYGGDPRAAFFLRDGNRDVFGLETRVTRDPYELLSVAVQTPAADWTRAEAVNDYRVLQTIETTNPNGNRVRASFDELGRVTATAVMGKVGDADGDTLANPTTVMIYDHLAWEERRAPALLIARSREQHGDPASPWQERHSYFDGHGRTVLSKHPAPPGDALHIDAGGNVFDAPADPRWIGNGRTILNNKGQPVRSFEPYFSATSAYEDERSLRERGETATQFYDPVGRVLRVVATDGTLTRATYGAWSRRAFDANDTVLESTWYTDRGAPDPGGAMPADPDSRAAFLAAQHVDTPLESHSDSTGATVLTRSDYGGGQTSDIGSEVDITGRINRSYDPFERLITEEIKGMVGQPISGWSAERGRRFVFSDVIGRVVRTWDEQDRRYRPLYDDLHRLIGSFVRDGAGPEVLLNYVVYGDRLADGRARNLLGVASHIYDQAGVMRIPRADFRGQPAEGRRQIIHGTPSELDWTALSVAANVAAVEAAAAPLLDPEVFTAAANLDALGRPVDITIADGTVIVPEFDVANGVRALSAQIGGAGPMVEILRGQTHNARGQRLEASHGNDTHTTMGHDPLSGRLTRLTTTPDAGGDPLQDIHLSYDAVGNVTTIRDLARQDIYFANAVVTAEQNFEYDAVYQLVRAEGREHVGAMTNAVAGHRDPVALQGIPHPNDANAMRRYRQIYSYDLAGNITSLQHRFLSGPGAGGGWRRDYRYARDLDPNDATNRVVATTAPGDAAGTFNAAYGYDAYGNMTAMPHLPAVQWDRVDRLVRIDLGGGGEAHYIYGADAQRVKKIVDRPGNRREEWIYLGPLMIYRRRRRDTGALIFERHTLTLGDPGGGVSAEIYVKRFDADGFDAANALNQPLVTFQYSDQLGAGALETDANGAVISVESYHPFGTTAYRVQSAGRNLSLKRFRFAGKEKDDETGLQLMGLRYYAPWLGRWTSADPIGVGGGQNLYQYCANNPVMHSDAMGTDWTMVSFTASAPPDFAYTENEADARAGYLQHGFSGTAVFRNSETGQEVTLGAHVTLRSTGQLVRATQGNAEELGRHRGQQFWQLDQSNIEVEKIEYHRLDPDAEAAVVTPQTGGPPSDAPSEGQGDGGAGAGDGDAGGAGEGPGDGDSGQGEGDGEGTGEGTGNGQGNSDADVTNAATAAREVAQEAARPRSTTGARARGTLHLWSGSGKADARAAIARDGSGWMMGDIDGNPTARHARAKVDFARATASAPGGRLPDAEFTSIWGRSSADVVGRGAFAGHPVEGHGVAGPDTIQYRYERPARMVGGSVAGGFGFASGMFTAITGAQDPNPALAISNVLLGVGEATSGIIYGSGAILGSGGAMAIGTAGMTAFGGAAAAVGFGTASVRSFQRGDNVGGVVNALGAIGGVLMIASLFTPVGWVGLLGVGLVALAAGFNLGRWFGS